MAVRFVLGRAGSGKTHRCLEEVRRHLLADPVSGPSLLLFVPEQAAAQVERMLLGRGDLAGATRCSVLSFRRLQNLVLAETGLAEREVVGPVGRQMIVQYLLLRHRKQLRLLEKVAARPGTAAKVAASLVEFMQEGILSHHLQDTAARLRQSRSQPSPLSPQSSPLSPAVPPAVLADKLHDLGLLHEAYLRWLGEGHQADPAALLAETADRLTEVPWLRGAHVWVDGFAGFSAQQRYALVRLAQAARHVEIALLLDPRVFAAGRPPDPYDLFFRTWQTAQQLRQAFDEAGVEVEEPLLLTGDPPRFKDAPVLAHIESQIFRTTRPGAMDLAGARELEIIAAPNRQAEVEAVARKIADLTRVAPPDQALRCRQIAVLVRDLEPYHDLFATIFAAHEIPCFIDRRRNVSYHPLVELVRALLRLLAEDWPLDAAASLLQTGLVPVPRQRADLLANYLLAHGIAGWQTWSAADWRYRRRLVGADEDPAPPSEHEQQVLAKANYARRILCDLLRGWAEAAGNALPPGDSISGGCHGPVDPPKAGTRAVPAPRATALPSSSHGALPSGRDWAERLYTTLERLHVARRLDRWRRLAGRSGGPAGLEQGQRHARVWSLLTQLLDDLVAALGDEPMTAEQFQATIEAGLEAFSLPLVPPVVDQVVVGSVERSRQGNVDAVFVLGFNEVLFPRRPGQDVLLSDQERDWLSQVDGRMGLATARQRLFDERLLAYIALTRASRYAWISYAAADESGKRLEPSPYLRALQAALPGLEPRRLKDPLTEPDLNNVGTRWQGATALVLAGRRLCAKDASPGEDGWAALWGRLKTDGPLREKVRRVASACDYTNACTIRPEQAAALCRQPFECSVSQLQEYAVCPYRYFARYVLRLKERPEFELAAVELGSFYHRILYQLATKVRQRRQSLRTVPDEVLAELVSQTTDEEFAKVVEELALTSGRQEYLLRRAKVDIGNALRGHVGLWKDSRFEPAALEARFGLKDGLPALTVDTPKGRRAVLRGKIDRIDRASLNDQTVLAVIDYKRSGKYKLRLDDALAGLQIQLIAYMKAAMQAGAAGRLGPGPAVPGGMYYFNLLPDWEKVPPAKMLQPAGSRGFKQWQLRGLTNSECLEAFRQPREGAGAADQPWPVNVWTSQSGKLHGSAPAVSAEQFRAVINQVWKWLAEALDRILDGDFTIQPYKAGRDMPCPYCPYDAVCRFAPEINQYRQIDRSGSMRKILETLGLCQDKPTS